jgi:hypothetical protein
VESILVLVFLYSSHLFIFVRCTKSGYLQLVASTVSLKSICACACAKAYKLTDLACIIFLHVYDGE